MESDPKGSSVGDNLNFEPRKDASHYEYAGNTYSDDQMKSEHQSQCSEHEDDKAYTRTIDTDPSTGHSKRLEFEVGSASAEEELDMLLNSFSGTHLSSSNLDELVGHDSTSQGTKISWSDKKVTLSKSSKSPALALVDNALDDLLSETSLPVQNEGFATQSSTSQPTVKSGQNFDFGYAKKVDVIASIDDSLDNLLEDTPSCLSEPKETTTAQGRNKMPHDSVPLILAPQMHQMILIHGLIPYRREKGCCCEEVMANFRILLCDANVLYTFLPSILESNW